VLELYHIMVRLTVHDGVSRGLTTLSQRFAKTNEEAVLLQNNINKIKTTMLAGAGMAFMGGLGLAATAKMLKPASEYLHTLNQAHAVGMKNVEVAEMTAAAWKTTAQVQTVSVREALQTGIAARRILGSTSQAVALLPEIAKIKSAFILAREAGRLPSSFDATQMAYTTLKTAEMYGATSSPAEFKKYVDNVVRMVVGTAGKVGPMQLGGLLKYARAAGLSLSSTELFRRAPILMEEMNIAHLGGSGAARGGPGSIYNAFYRMMVQGIMTKQTRAGFQSLGLFTGTAPLTAAQAANYQKMYEQLLKHPLTIGAATRKTMTGLPLVGARMAATDPINWIFSYLEPALRKQYPNLGRRELAAKAGLYFKGNTLAGWLATNAIAREQQIKKEMRMLGGVPGVDALLTLGKSDTEVAYGKVKNQWENLMVAIGRPLMKQLIPAFNGLATVLGKLATFFKRHPTLGMGLVSALGALSIALGFSGIVLILAGAFGGLAVALTALGIAVTGVGLATGITEIAVALGVLFEAVLHWKTLLSFGKNITKHPLETMAKGSTLAFHYLNPLNWSGMFLPDQANSLGIHVRPHTEHKSGGHIYMDGKKVGKVVSGHIGKELERTATHQKSKYDIGLSLPGVNFSF